MARKDLEERREYQARWYRSNCDRLKERSTKYYSELTNTKRLVNSARQRALRKGWAFDITHEDIVIPKLCPILQQPLERFTPYAPSIDRIDSTKGYTKDNVWVISCRANLMKNDASQEELERFAKWVLKL